MHIYRLSGIIPARFCEEAFDHRDEMNAEEVEECKSIWFETHIISASNHKINNIFDLACCLSVNDVSFEFEFEYHISR